MILVSACLVGVNCRYNGEGNNHPDVLAYLKDKQWIPICPEQLGGLPTPRSPAEITNGDGADVLSKEASVVTQDGLDVSESFIRGAEETLHIAQLSRATEAILKERSPSCGSCQIYDGSFEGKKKLGSGVTATLLKLHGIQVRSEEDL
ncbi:MAG: DUF523 domain-containing protein [Halanaerobiales bacterium]|nr:DUF523 domain-containing protein [Halanaerobiales bacterium]